MSEEDVMERRGGEGGRVDGGKKRGTPSSGGAKKLLGHAATQLLGRKDKRKSKGGGIITPFVGMSSLERGRVRGGRQPRTKKENGGKGWQRDLGNMWVSKLAGRKNYFKKKKNY